MSADTPNNLPANQAQQLPGYLQNVEVPKGAHSAWGMDSYSKPARIVVVQGLSKPPLKPPFIDGDVILTPKNIKIGDSQTPITITPIGFFTDFLALNPQGTQPWIKERSFDPASDVAKKAKAFAKVLIPGTTDKFVKYVTNLNFIVFIHGYPDLEEMPVHMSFNRGIYKVGQSFITLIQDRRNAAHFPFCHRYQCLVRQIPGKDNNNFPGLDIKNDPEPWCTEDQYKRYEIRSKELQELILAGAMQTEIDNESGGTDDNAANETKY